MKAMGFQTSKLSKVGVGKMPLRLLAGRQQSLNSEGIRHAMFLQSGSMDEATGPVKLQLSMLPVHEKRVCLVFFLRKAAGKPCWPATW